MKKMNLSRFISIGGILTTITVLFQAAPIFLPTVGLALSPLSTLPIGIAAVINISLGIAVFFSSTLILTIFSVQESIILLFSTGLLGMVMGKPHLHRWSSEATFIVLPSPSSNSASPDTAIGASSRI